MVDGGRKGNMENMMNYSITHIQQWYLLKYRFDHCDYNPLTYQGKLNKAEQVMDILMLMERKHLYIIMLNGSFRNFSHI